MKYLEMDPRETQDRQIAKLQNQIIGIEQQMREHEALRRKLEEMGDLQSARTEKTYERIKSQNRLLQEEIERQYGNNDTSRSNSQVLQQVMSLRAEEFQKSQAKKANQIKHLAAERQRIMDARNRLRQKQDLLRSLPSPIGKGTHKHWGHKYSLYTPLPYDGGPRLYTPIRLSSNWGTTSPVWDKSYYTYFPHSRLRAPNDSNRDVVYVPMPLYKSSFW